MNLAAASAMNALAKRGRQKITDKSRIVAHPDLHKVLSYQGFKVQSTKPGQSTYVHPKTGAKATVQDDGNWNVTYPKPKEMQKAPTSQKMRVAAGGPGSGPQGGASHYFGNQNPSSDWHKSAIAISPERVRQMTDALSKLPSFQHRTLSQQKHWVSLAPHEGLSGEAAELVDHAVNEKLDRVAAGGPGSGRHSSGLTMGKLKSAAWAHTKIAQKSGNKADHQKAADLHNEYADRLADRMKGGGYSHALGDHSNYADYHTALAKGKTPNFIPKRYDPKQDPASMSYRYTPSYYD
jgi:hypothetical protein